MSYLLNLIYILLLIVASPWIVWRRVTQGRYKEGWREKLFGNLPRLSASTTTSTKDPTKRRVWFHAVSVGELQVIRPVIELAQSEWPHLQIVVTTSTDSGYELAKKLYSQHHVAFAPLDFTWAIQRALDRIEPDLLVMAELELWPNWLSITARQGIPIAIINARLSARSLSGYLRIAPFITSVLSQVNWIGTQSSTYRNRFLQLSYPRERIDVTGNIKFDGATPDREHPEVAMRRALLSLDTPSQEGERIVWLCGSTQSPEESLCLQAMSEMLPRFPGLRMILVPRHAERFDEVAKLVEASGLPWLRRSQLTDAPTGTQWRVLLADSVGELRWWWGLADIGFVGGSFGSRGGQNMIEPCAYGVATSFGPNTRNFTDVVQLLLESDGAVQFQDPAQIVPWVTAMIENPSERQALQERAKELVQKQRGAVQRTWSQLKTLIASND